MKIFHVFGDSVTLGVNDAPAGGWVARLAGKAAEAGLPVPPDTFYNMGVRKNSSRMILSLFAPSQDPADRWYSRGNTVRNTDEASMAPTARAAAIPKVCSNSARNRSVSPATQ